ncbi:MAG: glycosyltransferase family 2 protein [Eubacterium sp.]|nr:glycosyltransferase family 2 protein [Eubacterium sp.]
MSKILTISVAAYNIEKYIDKLMSTFDGLDDSVMNKMEVIVENDGSSDATAARVNEYVEMWPGTIRLNNKENGGYGSTINASIKLAKGKYFKQLDGDDWYVKENLPEFLEFLEHHEADLIISPYNECYEEEDGSIKVYEKVSHTQIPEEDTDIENVKITQNLLMHELAVKTELLQKNSIHITERCFYTDNEYTCLPLLKAHSIARFGKPIYCYRLGLGEQSVSLSGLRKHYRDNIRMTARICKEFSRDKGRMAASVEDYMLNLKLKSIVKNTYTAYMVLEHPEDGRKELMKFDRYLRIKYPEIYAKSGESKRVRIPRVLGFVGYNAFAAYVLKDFEKSLKKR